MNRGTSRATVVAASAAVAVAMVLFGTGPAVADQDSEPPEVPSNLRVTDLQANTVTVAWDASDGATDYLVSRYGSYWYPVEWVTTDELSHTFFVSQGFTYEIGVSALGPGGHSAQSDRVEFTTPVDPDNPAVTMPSNLEAAASVDHTGMNVTVRWDPSASEAGGISYQVLVERGWERDSVGADETTATFDARPDTRYELSVRATDAAGRVSEWSGPLPFTTPVLDPPSTPANVRVDTSPGSVTVGWDPSTSETSVKDYRVTVGNAKIITDATTATWDYAPGGEFDVTVEARDVEYQWSTPSAPVEFTLEPADGWEPPTAPTNLRANFDEDGRVSLVEWDAASGGHGELTYTLYIEGFGDFERTKKLHVDLDGYFRECAPGKVGASFFVTATSFGFESPPSEPINLC